jgi:hypothetical protein
MLLSIMKRFSKCLLLQYVKSQWPSSLPARPQFGRSWHLRYRTRKYRIVSQLLTRFAALLVRRNIVHVELSIKAIWHSGAKMHRPCENAKLTAGSPGTYESASSSLPSGGDTDVGS